MTPKEKAEELIEKFSPYVYCYVGSGMLSDYYDKDIVRNYANECCHILCDEIIDSYNTDSISLPGMDRNIDYWKQVKENLK